MLWLILLFLIVCLNTNFKKTVLYFAPFKIMVLDSLFLGSFMFQDVISLVIAFFYYVNNRRFPNTYSWRRFPFLIPFLLMWISISLTHNYSSFHPQAIIMNFFRTFFFSFILYVVIEKYEDVKLVLKSTFAFAVLIIANAGVEVATGQSINPIGDFLQSYSIEDSFFATEIYDRGMRIRSFMPHSIGFGNVCALLSLLFLFWYIEYRKINTYIILVLCLVICVVLSLSRTPMLGLLVYLVPIFFNIDSYKRNKFLYVLFIVGGILVFDRFYYMIDTLFNTNAAEKVGGSSFDLRLEQFEACLFVISDSPWIGIGEYSEILKNTQELHGAESVWFDKILRFGIIGCITYLLFFVYSITESLRNSYTKYLLFLTVGYLLSQSSTYNTGIDDYIFCLIYLIIFKLGIYKNKN